MAAVEEVPPSAWLTVVGRIPKVNTHRWDSQLAENHMGKVCPLLTSFLLGFFLRLGQLEEIMESIPELIERLLEIQSGGRQRRPNVGAEDGRNGGMFACPYCKEKTDVQGAANLWMVFAAIAPCEHCGKEFVIVENFPMTEPQYRAASPNVRPLRVTA
jgi:hypothetical protein